MKPIAATFMPTKWSAQDSTQPNKRQAETVTIVAVDLAQLLAAFIDSNGRLRAAPISQFTDCYLDPAAVLKKLEYRGG